MTACRRRRALVTTDAVGGVWVYTLELLRALQPVFDVKVAVLGPAPSPAQMAAADAAGAAVHVTELPLEWTVASAGGLARVSRELAGLAALLEVDVVQLHSSALIGAASWPVPVLAVLHSCVGTWWHALHGRLPPPEDFGWRMEAVREGLQAADAVIAPTQALRDAARAVYDTERAIHVVHNARRPMPARKHGERTGVLAAGRLWDEAKNIATLDRAASRMGDVPVLAAGPVLGPNGAEISLRAIHALGPMTQDALHGVMGEAGIFAAPAFYEPFGLAVLEAAQTGLPLVLADIPSFRELWDGAACFLPPHNPDIWARVLVTLHRKPEECRAWGGKARARAARYNIEHFDNVMLKLYQRLLGLPARARAA